MQPREMGVLSLLWCVSETGKEGGKGVGSPAKRTTAPAVGLLTRAMAADASSGS